MINHQDQAPLSGSLLDDALHSNLLIPRRKYPQINSASDRRTMNFKFVNTFGFLTLRILKSEISGSGRSRQILRINEEWRSWR